MIYNETIQSEKLYSKIAEAYDQIFERAILAEGRLTSVVRRYMDDKSILDLACGNGRWLRRFSPASYIGIDLNQRMLEQARAEFPRHTFLQANMINLPFPDASFEGVVSLFGAMGHLPPKGQERMIREVHRVLREDAVAILTNGNMWSPFNLPTTLKRNRIKLEGVYLKVHSSTPTLFEKLLRNEEFEVMNISSYDYSYLPIAPLKLGASLLDENYRHAYSRIMDVLENCQHIPILKWFGKQLVAVCRKPRCI